MKTVIVQLAIAIACLAAVGVAVTPMLIAANTIKASILGLSPTNGQWYVWWNDLPVPPEHIASGKWGVGLVSMMMAAWSSGDQVYYGDFDKPLQWYKFAANKAFEGQTVQGLCVGFGSLAVVTSSQVIGFIWPSLEPSDWFPYNFTGATSCSFVGDTQVALVGPELQQLVVLDFKTKSLQTQGLPYMYPKNSMIYVNQGPYGPFAVVGTPQQQIWAAPFRTLQTQSFSASAPTGSPITGVAFANGTTIFASAAEGVFRWDSTAYTWAMDLKFTEGACGGISVPVSSFSL